MKSNKNTRLNIIFFFFSFFYLGLNSQNPFVENKGQWSKKIITKTTLPSGNLFVERAKFTYVFYDGIELSKRHDQKKPFNNIKHHAYSMTLLGANKNPKIELLDSSRYYENYFIGNKENWTTKVRSYKKHVQKSVYDGIDLHIEVINNNLKYEFHVLPFSNTDKIKLEYLGLNKIEINEEELNCFTDLGIVTEKKPIAYQYINDDTVNVNCQFMLEENTVSFFFPDGYNLNNKLIIDPVLEFSTYSGSYADNFGYTATHDNFGFLYSGSTVFATGYPTTLGAYDSTYNNSAGGTDIAITKYDTSGTIRIYSTYLGGDKDELPHSMIVNTNNELFIFGTTGSSDYPVTNTAYQTNFLGGSSFAPAGIGANFPDGSDIFISKLDANGGGMQASTFIGGSENDGLNTSSILKYNYADEVRGEIDIDKNNNVYIATCTRSKDFPITNSFQNNLSGEQEGCIIKMDNQLTSILWSSFLGGSKNDAIYSLAIDKQNNIYVTGGTNSNDFPITPNAYLISYQDSVKADAFVTKILSDGTQILNSTYYGTNQYDQSYFVEIGGDNKVYLFGQSEAKSMDLVSNATYYVDGANQFIAIFSSDLDTLIRSTAIGTGKGSPDISPTAFLVDVCDKIYIAGWGSNVGGQLSTLNLPISQPPLAYQSITDGNDFYLMVLDDGLSSILYATYFGGSQSNEHVDGGTSRFDKKGVIYQSVCAGCGGNSDFPIEPDPGAVSATNNSSNCNNGVFKFNFDFPIVVADYSTNKFGCSLTVDFLNLTKSSSLVNFYWDFGDGNTSTMKNPSHTFSSSGMYDITLIASDPGSCNFSDTIVKKIFIFSNSKDTIPTISKCMNQDIHIGFASNNLQNNTYYWTPPLNLTSQNVSNPITNTPTSKYYQLIIKNRGCVDTLIQKVEVIQLNVDIMGDSVYCNKPLFLEAVFDTTFDAVLWSGNINFIDTLSTSLDVIINNSGSYYVMGIKNNCVVIDSIVIKTKDIDINLVGNSICQGDSVVISVDNNMPQRLTYFWQNNLGNTASITDFPDTSSWYVVRIENLQGCYLYDSIYINVYQKPNIDTLFVNKNKIYSGERLLLTVQTQDNFNWIDYNLSSKVIEQYPSKSQCYFVEAFNQYNCFAIDSICVEVLDVFCNEDSIIIPTAFTPNQDNINEQYYITDMSGIVTDYKLEIFNRLGQKVFKSFDINEKWDGVYKGKMLSPQVFDFYLELKCIGGKKLFKKGNITLIK